MTEVEVPSVYRNLQSKTFNVEKTISENHKELQSIFDALNQDFQKFNLKKVKIAGARVRNNLLNCKKLCDKLRKQIQNEVRALPTKHRIIEKPLEEKPLEEKPLEDPNVEIEKPLEVKEIEEKPKVKRTRKANKLKVSGIAEIKVIV